jgi:hypothetical protein
MEKRKMKKNIQKTINKPVTKKTPSKNIDSTVTLLFKKRGNQTPLTAKEERDALLILYKKNPDIDLIIKQTGLPPTRVKKFLGYHTLIPALQEKVDAGEISVQAAMSAQDIASNKKRVNTKKAIEFAKVMTTLSSVQMKKMEKIVKENPSLKVAKIIALVNKKKPSKQILHKSINEDMSKKIVQYGQKYPKSLITAIFGRIIKNNHRIIKIQVTSKTQ